MTQKKAIIVKSATPPANTEVLWLDLSLDLPQLKSFINGGWKPLNSESTEVTDLRNELNASINEVNETLNNKIDTNVSVLNDKIDISVDTLNDKIDDEVAALAETSQGIQEDLDSTKTRVATLEDTYESTMNIANLQINELVEGKAQIAQALTDRGYPTQPTDSSASMAQKITDMAYDAGWLAQLGYDEQNDGGVKDAVAYSKQKKIAWENGAITTFQYDYDLAYCPMIDTSQVTNMYQFFSMCGRLEFVPLLNTSNVTNMGSMFESCTSLRTIPQFDFGNVTNAYRMFANFPSSRNFKLPKMNTGKCTDLRLGFGTSSLVYVTDLDVGAAVNLGISNSCQYAIIRNLGKVTIGSFWELPTDWGLGSEENNASLQTSIGDLSYDRISAGLEATAIKIKSACFNRLTAETIAKATDKGITLTVV